MQLTGKSTRDYIGVILFLINVIVCTFNGYPAQALTDSSANNMNNFFFICEPYDYLKITCYPSNIHVDGRLTTGSSGKVYTVSSTDADYSNDQNHTALSLSALLGEYIAVDKSNKFNFDNFSVSFWIQRADWFDTNAPVLSFINANSTAGWVFDLQENGSAIRFGITDGGNINSPKIVQLDSNSYVNIVGTFDGSNVRIYRNGKLFDDVAFGGHYNPNPETKLRIGLDSFDNENSWGGMIDNLRIYNRSLDEFEVKTLFTSNDNNITNGLVGYWPFDGNLNDTSGNNNHASSHVQAVSMAFAPDGRLFFSEKRTGEVKIMKDDKILELPFVTLSGLYFGDHEGLLGIALDPRFESNHYVYLYATYEDSETGDPFNKVIRLTDRNNLGTNVTILVDKIPADPDGNYAGGALVFGPDGKLYVTVGMGPSPGDSQNVSSMLGKVLRINNDGTIPDDNPFANSPVYTLGHRNMFGIAFDESGHGIVTENGDTHFDELNLLQKGGNYGFPNIQNPALSSLVTKSNFIQPIREYDRVIAPAQTIFYTGIKYPGLNNRFIVASYNDGNLHAIGVNETHGQIFVDDLIIDFEHVTPDNIVSVAQSPSGNIYYGGYDIYKLQSLSASVKQLAFPVRTNLSRGIDIKEMTIFRENNTLTIQASNNESSKGVIQLSIPMNLIEGLNSVSAAPTNESYPVEQNIVNSPITFQIHADYESNTNLVNINVEKMGNFMISAKGTETLRN